MSEIAGERERFLTDLRSAELAVSPATLEAVAFVPRESFVPLTGVRAHICRTEGPVAFPEETPTRQDQRLSNQLRLDLDPVVVPLRPAPAGS